MKHGIVFPADMLEYGKLADLLHNPFAHRKRKRADVEMVAGDFPWHTHKAARQKRTFASHAVTAVAKRCEHCLVFVVHENEVVDIRGKSVDAFA